MSEEETGNTSILLPAASVELITTDGDTKDAFLAIEKDWRFARVTLSVVDGDVETATKYYQEKNSPDLIIIQTEDIDDSFSDKLENLAGYLSEGTAAIIIGPVNDVNLYRKLVNMGVSDYLVKPVNTHILAEDIAATLIRQMGVSDSRLVAVIGAKGGVGVTSIAECLAWLLSDNLGQKTFLLDAAGGKSSLSVGMGFEPSTTLAEATRAAVEQNEDSLTRMIHRADERLYILSSGGDIMLEDIVEPDAYEALLDTLMMTYPVVIVDLSSSSTRLQRTVLKRAHHIELVTTPVLSSVRAARTLFQEIRELRGSSDEGVELIVNMQGLSGKHDVPKAQIEEGVELTATAALPVDVDSFAAIEGENLKLPELKGGKAITEQLIRVAGNIVKNPVEEEVKEDKDAKGLGGILARLKAKS